MGGGGEAGAIKRAKRENGGPGEGVENDVLFVKQLKTNGFKKGLGFRVLGLEGPA